MLRPDTLVRVIAAEVLKYLLSPHAGLTQLEKRMRQMIDEEVAQTGGLFESGKRVNSHDKDIIWWTALEMAMHMLEDGKFNSQQVATVKINDSKAETAAVKEVR